MPNTRAPRWRSRATYRNGIAGGLADDRVVGFLGDQVLDRAHSWRRTRSAPGSGRSSADETWMRCLVPRSYTATRGGCSRWPSAEGDGLLARASLMTPLTHVRRRTRISRRDGHDRIDSFGLFSPDRQRCRRQQDDQEDQGETTERNRTLLMQRSVKKPSRSLSLISTRRGLARGSQARHRGRSYPRHPAAS